MEELNSQTESSSQSSDNSNTSQIFKQFQDLYAQQLSGTDESSDGLKLKIKILQNWVEDLTDQNIMLIRTVGELEGEALKKISLLEENLLQDTRTTSHSKSSDKQIEYLCNDIWNLLELLRRLREDGFWYLDGLVFKTVSYEDIFGIPPWTCSCKTTAEKPHCWKVAFSPSCSSGHKTLRCCCCHP